MTAVPRVLLSVAGALTLAVLAMGAPSAADVIQPKIDFQSYTLDNGLEVLLSEDHRVPMVAVNIWYHVGAKNEVPGRSGFAHLFEHIMFQGSRNVPEDTFFKFLEAAGAPPDENNGTTGFDRTNYFETVPSNQLDLALWLESDRMGFLVDTLTQERLDNQRDVVRKERQQSRENVPYGPAEEQFYKLLFPAPHPYNGVIIGSHEDLKAATLEDVTSFFKTWYIPNNATLAIVGDFNAEDVKARVSKYFASIPRGPAPPALTAVTEPIKAERRMAVTDQVELSRVYMGWITPPGYQPGDAELQLAGRILSAGKASRLTRALMMDKQIAADATASQDPMQLGSVFSVDVLGTPGTSVGDIETATWKVLEDFAAAPPTAEELARALRTWQAETLRGLEGRGGFDGKANILNSYRHYTGNAGYLPTDFARFAAVTPEAIQKVFAAQIRADNRVVVMVSPEAGGEK